MRLKQQAADISGDKVREFYEQRAQTYDGQNVNNVTMLQDKNPALSEERNTAEITKLLPKLKLDSESAVLDLACGAGRWLDALPENISKYRGIDFAEGLIDIARSRNTRKNAAFFTGSVLDVDSILASELGTFNRILMFGLLPYMNDTEILRLFRKIPALITDMGGGLLCVRSPIGTDYRLTLKDFYSEELKSDYNAIYRTRDEYIKLFEDSLIPAGFSVTDEGFMFDDGSLNNRKETIQYYFILER